MRRNRAPDRLGLGQAAIAEFAAGHRALIGVKHGHTGRGEQFDIALGRLVLPHPHIHGGHGHHRLVGGEDQRGGKIIGNPARHLGKQIGGRRAHHHQISLAAQLDMTHLGLVLEVEQVGVDLVLAQCGERHRGDELLAALGNDAGDLAAALADQAHQLAGLVGCDAAAHDQQDARDNARHRPRPPCLPINAIGPKISHAERQIAARPITLDAPCLRAKPRTDSLGAEVCRDVVKIALNLAQQVLRGFCTPAT